MVIDPGVEDPGVPGDDDIPAPSEAILEEEAIHTILDQKVHLPFFFSLPFRKFVESLNHKVITRKFPEFRVQTTIKCDRSEPTISFDLGMF